MKLVLSVVASVLLAVSSVLGIVHFTPKYTEDFTVLRQAARTVEGEVNGGPFGMSKASCSAVSIRPDIHLTAAHCYSMNMKVDGVPAKVLKIDTQHDFMLLYADTDDSFVPVADAPVVPGDEVLTVGFPFGFVVGYVETITKGVVQGFVKGDVEYGTDRFSHWLFMTLPIAGGNSGGGIFSKQNGEWRVVSVVSMGAQHTAISPNTVMLHVFLKNAK